MYKENKRYREAIKEALEEEEQNLEGYESNVYKILLKALEGGGMSKCRECEKEITWKEPMYVINNSCYCYKCGNNYRLESESE